MSNGQLFKEEFQRLMRAINDSLERESELQRQLRRTKESLISVALRLQVAIKVSQEDELTISSLLNQAAESRTKEIIASRQAVEAHEMILSLNLEINALKRKLKAQEVERGSNNFSTFNSNSANNEVFNNMSVQADAEVDALMGSSLNIPVLPNTGGKPQLATPFDRWKMQQFVYAPDTPAASEAHDKAVVDRLVEASAFELQDDYLKPTKSGIAKMKRMASLSKIRANKTDGYDFRLGSAAGGANSYEGLGDDFDSSPPPLTQQTLQPQLHLNHNLEDEKFFLGLNSPMWGGGQRFDQSNLARNNLWMTSPSRGASSSAKASKGRSSAESRQGTLSPVNTVKPKTLRLSTASRNRTSSDNKISI